jgi:hypothetical protein
MPSCLSSLDNEVILDDPISDACLIGLTLNSRAKNQAVNAF